MGGIDHLSCNGWIIDPSRQNSCTNSYVVSVIRPSIFSLNHLPYMHPPPLWVSQPFNQTGTSVKVNVSRPGHHHSLEQ